MISCIIDVMPFVFPVKDSAPDADETQTAARETAECAADAVQEDRNDKGKDKDEKDKEKIKDKSKEKDKEHDKEKAREKEAERKGDGDKEKAKGVEGTSLDSLLQRLPGCVSRDLIDQLTVIALT